MKKTIVAFGDSLIKGNPIPETGGWVKRVFDHEEFKIKFNLINKGIGGDNTYNLIERCDLDCLQLKPFGVILGAGVNDSRIRDSRNMANEVPLSEYTDNLTQILNMLFNNSITVCLFAPLPVIDSLSDPYKPDKRYQLKSVRRYHDAFFNIAIKNDLPLIDVFNEWLKLPEEKLIHLLPDGVHPSPSGYEKIASHAEPIIRDWLTSASLFT